MAHLPAITKQSRPLMGDIPQWLQLALAVMTGVITASAFSIRSLWKMSDRIRDLEGKVGSVSVTEQIAKDRHDVIYPMVQAQFVLPLDRIEEEVKKQGQNIAILLDRDQTNHRLTELINTLSRKEP